MDKLDLIPSLTDEDIVTVIQIPYLGRKYYTELFFNKQLEQAEVEFN